MSGYVGDLSQKQEERLSKFKENLKDVLGPKHDDHCLLRFLRARNFDVHKSEAFFRKDLEWRARQGIDKLQDTFKLPEVCQKYWPGGMAGYDKDGGPVWIEPTGNADPKGLLQSCKIGDLVKYNICRMEGFTKEIHEQTQKLGKPIAGVTLIMDMHGLGRHHLWKPGVDLYNQINTILQDHYPETLKVILIIRAPKVFPLAYTLCRPYLNPDTRRKIHILGSDWRQVLLKYVSDDVLPVHWGGKATDPDGNPMCPSKICLGGEIPKSCYFQNVEIPEENMTVREIKRGTTLEFKYKVTKPGCFFRYAFKTKDHDIAFGIKRFDSNGQKVKVVETTRVNSHYVLQDGHVELETTGYYIVKFDNSFSWTKSKRISYILELLEPIDDLEEEHVSTTSNLNGNGVIENSKNGIKDNIEDNEEETKISANNKEMDQSVEEGVKDEVTMDKEESFDERVKDEENMDMKESIKQELTDEANEKSSKEEVKDEASENKKEINGETSVKGLPSMTSENKDKNEKQQLTDEAEADKDKSVTEGADVEDQKQSVEVVTDEAVVDKEEGIAEGANVEDQNPSGKEVTDVATAEKQESITDTADVEEQKQGVKEVHDKANEERREVKDTTSENNKEESIKEKSNEDEDMKENSIEEKDESAMKEVNDETIEDKESSVKEEERSEASDTNNETIILV